MPRVSAENALVLPRALCPLDAIDAGPGSSMGGAMRATLGSLPA
jgi:hypothetical protein